MTDTVIDGVQDHRHVAAHLECTVVSETELVLAMAVAAGLETEDEHLTITADGAAVPFEEVLDAHGTRLHRAASVPAGELIIDYAAVVTSASRASTVEAVDLIRSLRPSRYCESDRLSPVARTEFAGLFGVDLLDAVSSWVGTHVAYVSGSSQPTDGAVATYLSRRGVCRDFAHLVIALLRACDVPARLVSVYAPGLDPMDFHAVAEAFVDGRWVVVDATSLAPRSTMVRIATGRDAADTAFLTNQRGIVDLTSMSVMAYTDGALPRDDPTVLVQLH